MLFSQFFKFHLLFSKIYFELDILFILKKFQFAIFLINTFDNNIVILKIQINLGRINISIQSIKNKDIIAINLIRKLIHLNSK